MISDAPIRSNVFHYFQRWRVPTKSQMSLLIISIVQCRIDNVWGFSHSWLPIWLRCVLADCPPQLNLSYLMFISSLNKQMQKTHQGNLLDMYGREKGYWRCCHLFWLEGGCISLNNCITSKFWLLFRKSHWQLIQHRCHKFQDWLPPDTAHCTSYFIVHIV